MNTLFMMEVPRSGFDLLTLIATLVAEHRGAIYLLSSMTSIFFAIVMFAPFRRDATESWAKYFGWGFAVTSLQYAIRFAVHIVINYHWIASEHTQTVNLIEHGSVALCSAGNNVLFFVAALDLLEVKFKSRLEMLFAVFAVISFFAGVFDITAWHPDLSDLSQRSLIFYRALSFPDTILSALCLTLVGYATATNIFYRKFPFLAAFAILVGLSYGFIHVIYGLNPIIFNSAPVNRYVPLQALFGTREALNSFLFAVAFPLKFGLFLPGYVLHQRSLTAFYDVQEMLEQMVEGRDEFISYGGGIVKKIGERFRADLVDLSIKLPGKQNEQVASVLWESKPPKDAKRATIVRRLKRPSMVDSGEGRPSVDITETTAEAVIKWGLNRQQPFMYPQTKSALRTAARNLFRSRLTMIHDVPNQEIDEDQIPQDVRRELNQKKTLLLIPVKFHGASVGCIKIERNRPSYSFGRYKDIFLPFSHSALKLGKQIADLAAPSVQSYRELATLDRLSLQFAQALSEATAKTSGELYDFQEAVDLLGDLVYDALSPEAMRLVIDFGFSPTRAVDKGEDRYVELLRKKLGNSPLESLPTNMEDLRGNSFKLYRRELVARVSARDDAKSILQADQSLFEPKQFRIGYLIVAVRQNKDKFESPMLGANYLHRKAVASILSDAILDFGRAYLSRQLRRLSAKLNQEERLEIQQWFNDIEETAVQSGLSWLVTNLPDGEFIGSEHGRSIVKQLQAGSEAAITKTPNEAGIVSYQISPPVINTYCVVRLELPNSQYKLWLGINRPDFARELEFVSPWQSFLTSYIEIADAGLVRFTAVQEFQKLQIEAAQYQGLATIAVTMGTLAHQLTNMSRNQAAACSTLENIFDVGALRIVDTKPPTVTTSEVGLLIHSMRLSADAQMNLLEAFSKVTKVDDRRPCGLLEAVRQAITLFQTALLQNEITVDIQVESSLKIDVPFYVAALALGNLISNAKDAIDTAGKTISIIAHQEDGRVKCDVRDEGTGVDPRVVANIFNLGVTTKPYSGGWGLYLVKRSLLENGANIELANNGSKGEGTTFRIWFPAPSVIDDGITQKHSFAPKRDNN